MKRSHKVKRNEWNACLRFYTDLSWYLFLNSCGGVTFFVCDVVYARA